MTPEQITEFIENNKLISRGYCFSITIGNKSSFYGFFVPFPDEKELAKQNRWRFVPIDQYGDFYWDRYRTGSPNPAYSLIIEVSQITNIELIRQDRLDQYPYTDLKDFHSGTRLSSDKNENDGASFHA